MALKTLHPEKIAHGEQVLNSLKCMNVKTCVINSSSCFVIFNKYLAKSHDYRAFHSRDYRPYWATETKESIFIN